MEIKHKECFTPSTIKVWGLQSISKYTRETAEFVNLYSARGVGVLYYSIHPGYEDQSWQLISKRGGSGVFVAGKARHKHPAPLLY